MSGYLWIRTFRYEIPPTDCFHIAATHRTSGTEPLRPVPLSYEPALALRLGLSPLHVVCCHSLHWLRLFPAKETGFHRTTLLVSAFTPVQLRGSLPLWGSARPMIRPNRACVLVPPISGGAYVGLTPLRELPHAVHNTHCPRRGWQ